MWFPVANYLNVVTEVILFSICFWDTWHFTR